MSARPVIKTSHMSLAMQESAVMAAMVMFCLKFDLPIDELTRTITRKLFRISPRNRYPDECIRKNYLYC